MVSNFSQLTVLSPANHQMTLHFQLKCHPHLNNAPYHHIRLLFLSTGHSSFTRETEGYFSN